MKRKPVNSVIELDYSLALPVYKQIIHSVCQNIERGILKKGDTLPSVNQIAAQFSLARGSVFSAFNDLRASGIIDSIPGKGYYVRSTQTKRQQNIFLLFSTFTPYKETLFNALINQLPKTSFLDIYFHHHSIKMFETLINQQADYYNTFIIMPEVHPKTPSILSKLDSNNTYLLDVGFKEYRKQYPGVYQNFEKNLYAILMDSQQLIKKYKRLILVFPDSLRTRDIITGFNKFSKTNTILTEIRNTVVANEIKKNDAYIVIDDNHLVEIIKSVKLKNWKLGQDIGIISYNETNLKSIISDGITTITADFEAMGRTIADMVVSGKKEVIENTFVMIDRKSF